MTERERERERAVVAAGEDRKKKFLTDGVPIVAEEGRVVVTGRCARLQVFS